jgi:hypothetical protein
MTTETPYISGTISGEAKTIDATAPTLATVYARANDADKVALIEAHEAHEIAYARAVRATRWHDAVRTPAARRAALAAHQVADKTFESLESAMLLADARAELDRVLS